MRDTRIYILEFSTHHQANHGIFVDLGIGLGSNSSSVPQNSNFVGDAWNLFKAVGYVDNRNSLATELVYDAQQHIYFRLRKGSSWFIHDKKSYILGRDFAIHHLSLSDAEVFHFFVWTDDNFLVGIYPYLFEQTDGINIHLIKIYESIMCWLFIQKYIFAYTHFGHQIQFLMDTADARGSHITYLLEFCFFSFQKTSPSSCRRMYT